MRSLARCLIGVAMVLPATPSSAASPFAPFARAGDLVHVSSVGPTDALGVVAGEDVAAQTRRTLENLDARLRAAGSGREHVAAMMVYLREAADFAAMNQAYAAFFPQDPPTRTTIVVPPADPKARVEMSAIALAPGAERRVVLPEGWQRSPNPYSYAIASGDTLFVSGLVARNPRDMSVVAGDVAAQTRAVLDNAGEILKAAGMSHADVVSARVYITDTASFAAMNEAYRRYFPSDPPARATVKAALAGRDYGVEITLLAAKGQRQTFATPNADGSPGRANPNLSAAVRVGRRLFLSGMLGNTEATRGDAAAQTRETLARLGRTLEAAGLGWDDVVDGLVYVTDARLRAPVEAIVAERLGRGKLAGVTLEVGLVAPDALVEIMLSAAR